MYVAVIEKISLSCSYGFLIYAWLFIHSRYSSSLMWTIWDASLLHSASSYKPIAPNTTWLSSRLCVTSGVPLYFQQSSSLPEAVAFYKFYWLCHKYIIILLYYAYYNNYYYDLCTFIHTSHMYVAMHIIVMHR